MATAQEWKTRIAHWKASGLTAAEFGAKHGLLGRQLHNWAYRLRLTKASSATPKQTELRKAHPVRLLRVLSQRHPQSTDRAALESSGVRLIMSGAIIDLRPGFDAKTLRTVLALVATAHGEES
jgi:transposase